MYIRYVHHLCESSPFPRRLSSIFKVQRMAHRAVTLHGDPAGSRGVCSLLLDSCRKTRSRIHACLIDVYLFRCIFCIFIISGESSPFPRRLSSIFKCRRKIHRAVTLHGDPAGSRGVCSLLLDSCRKTRSRIHACLIDVYLFRCIFCIFIISGESSPFPRRLSSIFKVLRIAQIEQSLFMETQLGPGGSALSCWTLLEKHEAGFMHVC